MKHLIYVNLLLFYAATVFSIPKYVMIIRHGELVSEHVSSFVFRGWHLKPIHLYHTKPLSPRGWQRAYGLAAFFTMEPNILNYGEIAALYAPMPNSDYNSVRPIQTLTPLSERMKKKINLKYNIDQGGALVNEIMHEKKYNDRVVLISYEHMHIPRLAQIFEQFFKYNSSVQYESSGISVQPTMDGSISLVPTQWGSYQDGTAVFDQVWVLTFDTKLGKVINFENVPQMLLYKDSPKPFDQRPVQTNTVNDQDLYQEYIRQELQPKHQEKVMINVASKDKENSLVISAAATTKKKRASKKMTKYS